MKTNRILESLLSLLATIFVLGLAYALESWMKAARISLATNFTVIAFTLQATAIHLVFALSVMILHWWVNSKARRNIAIAAIILLTGCALMGYPILYTIAAQSDASAGFLSMSGQLLPITFLSAAAGFLVVIGSIGLLRKQDM